MHKLTTEILTQRPKKRRRRRNPPVSTIVASK
ncbi:unnamed protein product [Spirodela intermedia]|uniref:Uncharacterized protein n=1 Tax=Spirodela intermedia TaxID=51605 RepID=A0A7I8JI73_SPIIN|nr:unnamed protein product [Spirodela intermedia]CAA6669445.1 unnamed protein product [Spirodela intermedia]